MNRHRIYIKALAQVLVLALIIIAALPAKAESIEPRRVVRVGFFSFAGYHDIDESGAYSGYGYELLQRMSGYTNWDMEYVGYDKSWNEMQNMLENGEIDLLTSAQKTAEREARFDFSNASIGISSTILTVREGNHDYTIENYSVWNGIRVGVIEGNSRNKSFDDFAKAHGFKYTSVYYGSTESMINDLKAGKKIDAAVTSNLRRIQNEWILAQFDSSPFYIMVRKGDTGLLSEVNSALDDLLSLESEISEELMTKYYTYINGDNVAYDLSEIDYIEKMQGTTLRAIINPDRPPFSYLDESGAPAGIMRDIADMIIARTGLNVEFVSVKDRAEYLALIESGEIDIRFDAACDYYRQEQLGYRLTTPYMEATLATLSRRDSDGNEEAIIIENSDVNSIFLDPIYDRYPKVNLSPSTDELITSVLDDRNKTGYIYLLTAEKAVRDDYTNSLIANSVIDRSTPFAVAVSADLGVTTYSIFSKAVASLGNEIVKEITDKYTNNENTDFSLIGYVYDYPVSIIISVVALFVLIGLTILFIHNNLDRRKKNLQLKEEERRNELLVSALSVAEQASNAKSMFLSRVSHEMRTPLNAIIGFLALSKGATREQIDTYLENSEVAARQLLAVINDVLDMSAIGSGKMKLAHMRFDFKQLINSITVIYAQQCRQKNIDYSTQLATPVDEWLIGDQLRVNQILINLLGNSVKFTESGYIRLRISQTETARKQVFMRFEVSDSGCGMSKEMIARLFRPFEQESSVTAQKYGGSGLGLSIVKSLVTMMDGAISVESQPGAGSKFVVDLPFTRSESDINTHKINIKSELRVLAVDDEDSERKYMLTVLERIGVRFGSAESGAAAISAISEAIDAGDPYNICIIDWMMPEMDGLEATRRLRERFGRDLIIILISAFEQSEATKDAIDAGANLFVPKPLFQSTLYDMFMTLTGGLFTKNKALAVSRSFTGRRVLLAEDNSMNRMVAEGMLKRIGINCETAEDGRIAADMFMASKKGYYDAILMDIQMPNLDGFGATKVIRGCAHPDSKKIQIIALTANAFSEDIAKTLAGGMNAHVAKPIDADALIEALANAFAVKDS